MVTIPRQAKVSPVKKYATSKEDFRYRINRLKEAIDAEQLLRMMGFGITRVTSKEVRGPCKVHGGDNKTSFRMNKETKNWVCFSHNCHEEVGYDVISLVRKMLHMNFNEALEYLESISGVNVHDERSYLEYKRSKDRQEAIQQMRNNKQMPSILANETYLKSFRKFRSDYFEREKNGGFPKEVLDYFEVGGGYVDKYKFQRDVIPIRRLDGELLAYSCRDITDKAEYDYKYLLTEGFDKDKVLYNFHNAKDFLGESKTVIVVEGFKSVWKLYMAGYRNAVACMGSAITGGQQNLLYQRAFNVILLFDADQAGAKGTVRALEDMKGKINMRPLFITELNSDPGDLTIEELRSLIGRIS